MDIEDFSSKALTVVFGIFCALLCLGSGFLAYDMAQSYNLIRGICTAFGVALLLSAFFIAQNLAADRLINTASLVFIGMALPGFGLILWPLFIF